ncbi:hypothetical protein HZS_3374 [Henneguya salminicola]|nr:hypothetical protein HZS_3374 [Henneguya salminicola]
MLGIEFWYGQSFKLSLMLKTENNTIEAFIYDSSTGEYIFDRNFVVDFAYTLNKFFIQLKESTHVTTGFLSCTYGYQDEILVVLLLTFKKDNEDSFPGFSVDNPDVGDIELCIPNKTEQHSVYVTGFVYLTNHNITTTPTPSASFSLLELSITFMYIVDVLIIVGSILAIFIVSIIIACGISKLFSSKRKEKNFLALMP